MNTNTKHWASITAGILSLAGYSSAAEIGSEKYTYDASGNIVEKAVGSEVTQFDYAGNLLKGSLLDVTHKQYQYDEAGRLIGEVEDGKLVRKLNYQFADKVTHVQNGEKTSELFYNAEGQLVGINSSGQFEAFSWDGLAVASRGEQVYANEEHVVGGVPVLVGNDVSTSDIVGTTLSIGRKSFIANAYGDNLKKGLYTGKPFVEELDGFVFKYRNYSPARVRWASEDPSGYPDGTNNSVYACQMPHQSYDRDGLEAKAFPTWTQVEDSAESHASPAHDVTYHHGNGTSQPLYREWDDDPDEEMRQAGISKTLTRGGSFRWGTSHSEQLGIKGGIKIWNVIELGADANSNTGAQVSGDWQHPGDSATYMIRPTREELTWKCKKKTYGTVTTTYGPYFWSIPITTYSSVSPPTTGTGIEIIGFIEHGGYDKYEK